MNCRRQAERHRNGEINREDYDKWRYNYPKYDEASGYVKVPSQQLGDALVEAFKDRLRPIKSNRKKALSDLASNQIALFCVRPVSARSIG